MMTNKITFENEKGETIVLTNYKKVGTPRKKKTQHSLFAQPTIAVYFKDKPVYNITFFRNMNAAWLAYEKVKDPNGSNVHLDFVTYFSPEEYDNETLEKLLSGHMDFFTYWKTYALRLYKETGRRHKVRLKPSFIAACINLMPIVPKDREILKKYGISNLVYWEFIIKKYFDENTDTSDDSISVDA